MIVTIVNIWVKPDCIEAFVKASIVNHENSIKEAGNLRFDLLQDHENENKFTFYEAYESEDAAAAHKSTAHYLNWRETVADMMAKPREGIKHKILSPVSKDLW